MPIPCSLRKAPCRGALLLMTSLFACVPEGEQAGPALDPVDEVRDQGPAPDLVAAHDMRSPAPEDLGASKDQGATGPSPDMGPGPDPARDLGGGPGEPDMREAPGGEDMRADVGQELVPMFVAQGHVGRTVISCDDGRTWGADRAFDSEGHALACGQVQQVRCFEEGSGCSFMKNGECEQVANKCDCDHHPGAANGLTWGDGWFVGTWGWGPRGGVMRSQDGRSWEMVVEETTFAGIAHGGGRFVTGARQPLVSTDGGSSWMNLGEADLRSPAGERVHNPRSIGFADVRGGRFVLTGASGDKSDVLVSPDGAQWTRPDPLPGECSQGVRGIAGGGGVIVISTRDGHVCASSDGGSSFQVTREVGDIDTAPIHDGQRFMLWGSDGMLTSVDGLSWTTAELTTGVSLGSVARNPQTGTLVAVRGGWKKWYEEQRFYRSTDGLTWEELAEGSYVGSHPIRDIAFGWAPAGTVCPAQ